MFSIWFLLFNKFTFWQNIALGELFKRNKNHFFSFYFGRFLGSGSAGLFRVEFAGSLQVLQLPPSVRLRKGVNWPTQIVRGCECVCVCEQSPFDAGPALSSSTVGWTRAGPFDAPTTTTPTTPLGKKQLKDEWTHTHTHRYVCFCVLCIMDYGGRNKEIKEWINSTPSLPLV